MIVDSKDWKPERTPQQTKELIERRRMLLRLKHLDENIEVACGYTKQCPYPVRMMKMSDYCGELDGGFYRQVCHSCGIL
jgi:hypothetical protein